MHYARVHLQKANALLSTPSEDNLRFAALNLRMCMEVLTYEKLQSYSDRVPPEVQKRWQPPQAVRALLAFEPHADQGYEIHIADRDVPDLSDTTGVTWLPLGEHKTLAVKWLGKHYNKVGGLLHAKFPSQSGSIDLAADLEYLAAVSADLDEVLNSTVSGSPFPVTTFACTECGSIVAKNSDALRAGNLAKCFNPQCGTEYTPKSSPDGGVTVKPILNYPPCIKCNSPMPTRPAAVRVGSELTCPNCKQAHRIAGHHWVYGPSET